MKQLFLISAVLSSVPLAGPVMAQVYLDLWNNPQDSNLGDIASDGTGGRQILVRPMEPEEIGRMWKFFPPHDILPESFPDPLPVTPAQKDVILTTGTPLVLVLPQLQHFPTGADVSVSHSLTDQQIMVDASINYLGYSTDTIYGPHEYLHPLGSLKAGQYHLTLNFAWSSALGSPNISRTTGFVDFAVRSIPEPSTTVLVVIWSMLIIVARRRIRGISVAP